MIVGVLELCNLPKPSLMKKVTSFRELEVYDFCRQLSKDIFELSKKFLREEMYSHRPGKEVLAVCWGSDSRSMGKRRYEKHFISKLTDANGEQPETPILRMSAPTSQKV